MEDLDNKLANALEAIKNQAPVPVPSKGKAKGSTAKAAPAPAAAQVPVAAAADVSPPADITSSDTDTGGVTPLALQHDDEISHKHDASASTKGHVKEQHNKEHASAHSTHAGAGSLIRLRTQSQDLNPKIMGKHIPATVASPNTNTVARRTSLIDNLDSETVDFTSTYESRHISPSPNLRLARERSRSRSSSVDTGTSLLGAGTCSGLGVSPLHTSSSTAAADDDVTNGPPTFDDEPISLTQHNHYVGTNEVDRDHIHAVYDLGRAVGTGEAAGIVDVQGNHLTAGEAAEIISENAYKRRIGDALTQQLLQQMGALPKAKPWSLDRADAPPSTARDSYVPDHRHSVHKTDNIQVVMRVRPLFKDEVATGTRRCMSLCGLDEQSALNRANYSGRGSNASPVSGMSADTSDVNGTRNANIVLVNPSVPVFEVDQLAQAVDADATFSKDIATVFNFDSCIWSAGDGIVGRPSKHADQAEVHAVIGKGIVNGALNGLSSVCFAYGEERSGKSHSLFGPSPVSARAPAAAAVSGGLGGGLTSSMSFPSLATLQEADRGLIPRVFSDILKGINFQDTKCTLAFVEIYNEKIHDLLGGAGNGSASTAQQFKGVPAATRGGVADAVRRGPGGARSTGAGVPIHATEKNVNSLFYRSTHHRKHSVRVELKVREHPLLGPYVDGMRKVRVRTEDDMYAIIQEAQQEKSYLHKANGSKANNGTVLCTLELTPLHDVGCHAKSKGGLQHGQKAVRVHMVDLAAAPSESLSNWRTSVKTASKASHLQEKARVINITMNGNSSVNIPKAADEVKVVRKSLSHLNYVLHSMERGAQMHALPFRDSCLTWLLRSTLTLPSSRITLLAHASPGDRSFDETSKTLKYAERLCLARDNHHRVHRFRQEDAKWVNGASLAPTAGSRTNATAITGATPRAKAISHAKAFSTSSKAPRQSAPTNEKSAAQNSVYQRQSPTTNSNNYNPAKVGSGSATISQQPHRLSADEELTLARADRDALLNTLPSPPTGSSTEDVAAPALVTASAADTQQVTMLKTTVLALQQALEGSIHEKNVLKAENDALRARISSGTTAADFSLACLERADAWRSRANSSNNNNNGEITSNEEEVQVARADVIAAHEALAAFQLDAQAQLQSLWTAVQELNKLDKQKEQAINDIVIERGTLNDKLKKARIKQGELEAELHMMDIALVEAAEEAVSRMEAPRSQSKSPRVRSPAYASPPRAGAGTGTDTDTDTGTGTANSSDEKHSGSKNKNNSSRPDAFTYRIAEGPPESPDVYTFSTASKFSPTRSSGSGSNDNTPKVTRPFNNSEEGDASAQAIAATDDDIEASPLEDMPEEELDEQIAKLSKFLVKDRRLLKMQRAQQARTP